MAGGWPRAVRRLLPTPSKDGHGRGLPLQDRVEAVMPVGMIEPDREDGIAREGQSVVTGCERTAL